MTGEMQPDRQTIEPASSRIDKVRASRDGHAFHEAWAARSALALLPPDAALTAIAIEGFDLEDEAILGEVAVEVADLVRYYGGIRIEDADRTEVVQFKYSIAKQADPLVASDLAKTLEKFAASDVNSRRDHGDAIAERVHYEFATNRPISADLRAAIAGIAAGGELEAGAEAQAATLRAALRRVPEARTDVLERMTVSGSLGSLTESRGRVGDQIASWGVPSDPQSRIRLRELQHLVRTKAEHAAQRDKIITRVTMLATFEIQDEDELYPSPDAFSDVSTPIHRPIVDDIIKMARSTNLPILLVGEGGMGKTVLMQAVAEKLAENNQVVLFDGFGAGTWRDPARPRHLASRTLVHLANLLAARGLNDIQLPSYQEDALLRSFRTRLEQAVATVREQDTDAAVVLLLDAIDHAGMMARDTGARSFAHLLLANLAIAPIEGAILIASCRPERQELAVQNCEVAAITIPPFSLEEARELILARDPSATEAEITALQTRSGCNPRCLDTFLSLGRPYDLDQIQSGDPQKILDELLATRIATAKRDAELRGLAKADLDALLAALAMLPPPVPMTELAAAQGISLSEIESFAADLSPLLERTKHGLMFRDEPIETLIGTMAQADPAARQHIINRLEKRQFESEYSARALPAVLTAAHDTDALVALAFETRAPVGASEIGKREIRMARITEALRATARAGRTDDVLRIALEASLVAAGHERADRFLYDYPDLAALSGDTEAMRRLFATRTGWPGGRHAALAIAYEFSGEDREAQRNAHRAIDWFNLRLNEPQLFSDERQAASDALDEIGFTYVEVITGNHRRIFDWIGRLDDAHAYDVTARTLDLAERRATMAEGAPNLPLFLRAVGRGHLPARGAIAAALEHSQTDRQYDARLVERLAATSPDVPDNAIPLNAVMAATLRAVDLRMLPEARKILGSAVSRANSIYRFDDFHQHDLGPVLALIGAGISACLAKRDAALLDLAPSDLLELVSKSHRTRGPAAFAKALDAQFNRKMRATKRRSVKPKRLSAKAVKEREWAEEGLDRKRKLVDHRLTPVLPYATLIARLLRSRPSGRATIIREWLNILEGHIATATAYPFKDGAAYVARLGGLSLLYAGRILQAFDEESAAELAALLADAPSIPLPADLWAVAAISRVHRGQNGTLRLAAAVAEKIRIGTDTGKRLENYGKLARSVWRALPDEAAAYFRRGLDIAEVLGTDDFERANSVLQLAGNYLGPQLPPQSGYHLARILELHLGDDDRYPWHEWTDAIRGVVGPGALALASRLADREDAELSFTLPLLLQALVTNGTFPADLAASMIGLGGIHEDRWFSLDSFAEQILPLLAESHRPLLFDNLLTEIDRAHGLSPLRGTIMGLSSLAGQYLPKQHPAAQRLLRMRPSWEVGSDSAPGSDYEIDAPDLPHVDLGCPRAIEIAIEEDTREHNGHRWARRTLTALTKQARTPAQRLSFLQALTIVEGAPLIDKLNALEDHVEGWASASAALQDFLLQAGRRLVALHARELIGTDWAVSRSWNLLSSQFGVDPATLAQDAIIGIGPSILEISGQAWLALAAELAPAGTQNALGLGLDRFLKASGEEIPGEIGDGPWQARFEPPLDVAALSAGLIFVRLGHPASPMRWRAAHSIVRAASYDRFDVVDELVALFHSDGGAFVSPKLPFFRMHAQLFLLIAIGRVARDYPAEMAKHWAFLEEIASSTEFPHVAMREAARDALCALLPALPTTKRSAAEQRLRSYNRSPFDPIERKFYCDVYESRPEGQPKRDNNFSLEYDFRKYAVAKVLRLFGQHVWEIEDAVSDWVRAWDLNIDSMYSDPRGRHENDRRGSWSSGSNPEIDRYGSYLGWHALELVTGDCLARFPVTADKWESERWLATARANSITRNDGAWLAEWSDLTPLDIKRDVAMPEKQRNAFYEPESQSQLSSLIGFLDTEFTSDRVVVYGDWDTPDDVSILVTTIVAPAPVARCALLAAMSAAPFFRYLPMRRDDRHRDEYGRCRHNVMNWVADDEEHLDRRIDRHDPYAASSSVARPELAPWLAAYNGLVPDDPTGRSWSIHNRPVLFGDAWGGPGGRYEKHGDRGLRLAVDRDWLLDFLAKQHLVMAGMVKADIYRKNEEDGTGGQTIYRTLGFTIDEKGQIHVPKRLPKFAREALSAMRPYDRDDFSHRFRRIMLNWPT